MKKTGLLQVKYLLGKLLKLVQKRELGGQWETAMLFELGMWYVLQY